MRRLAVTPRENWERTVEETGLIWHSDANGAYWQELNLQALSQQPQFLSISA